MKDRLNILITGAGSTMAQSILKSILVSKYSDLCNVIFTNSEVFGAGFFMDDKVSKCYIVPIAKDNNYIDKMIEICKVENIDILFSGTEHEIFALATAKDRFKNECNTLVMLSDIEVINIGTDKLKTAEFFLRNKLPFPKTVMFRQYKDLIDDVGYPIFMKPRVASASRNIYVIKDEKELLSNKFDKDENILLQEYLNSDDEYTVEVFIDKDEEVAGSIVLKRELQYGLSYWGKTEENYKAKKVAEDIAKSLKPMGPVNIQLKIINGEAIPFEINTRFSSTECVRANFGFNGVEAAIDNFYYGKEINLKKSRNGYFLRYWEECYIDESEMDKFIKSKVYLKKEVKESDKNINNWS